MSVHSGNLITFANFKGGSGKSTFAISFLQHLRQTRPDAHLLALDADDDGTMLQWVQEVPPVFSHGGPFAESPRRQFDFCALDLQRNLEELQDIVRALLPHYDYIVADVVGYAHPIAKALADLSSLVVIPAEPSPFAIQGLRRMPDILVGVNNVLFFNRVPEDPREAVANSPDGKMAKGLESIIAMIREHWPVFDVAPEYLHNSEFLHEILRPAPKSFRGKPAPEEAPEVLAFRNQLRMVNERIFSKLRD